MKRPKNRADRLPLTLFRRALVLLILFCWTSAADGREPTSDFLETTVRTLSESGDRSTGTSGVARAGVFIREMFEDLGLSEVGTHSFSLPVRKHRESTLVLTEAGQSFVIHPLLANAISPQTIPPDGLAGPLFYVGQGELSDFNGKPVEGSIILMEFDSGKNWLHAANLGARALIYVDRGPSDRNQFADKNELSPIRFPRFWIPLARAREIFGSFEALSKGNAGSQKAPNVRLTSRTGWERVSAENIYGLIPGIDPRLREELILVEAFYDSTGYVPGRSPGAEEASGIATLLALARFLKENSPGRSVLLVATAGHAQAHAGMRELVWSIRTRSKELRDFQKEIQAARDTAGEMLDILRKAAQGIPPDPEIGRQLKTALEDRIKTEVDILTRRLMRLRLRQDASENQARIKALAEERLELRRLGWRNTLADPPPEVQEIIREIIPEAILDYEAVVNDTERQLAEIKSARAFRAVVKEGELAAVVSLHLSSHGDGVGAFNDGWLYELRPRVNRVTDFSAIDSVLRRAGGESTGEDPVPFKDTLRPSTLRSWQSYFIDRPNLGGEVAALAGYLGFTLATVQDARPFWGTPYDVPERVDFDYLRRQARRINGLITALSRAPELFTGDYPRPGFANLTGRAKLLRQGELFPDQAAPGTMILAFQGPTYYHAMADARGIFTLKGVATKKLTLHKVIIEGYRYDPDTGEVIWAIDKNQTGKNAYRVKMRRKEMETDLVLFNAVQTTIFDLLEPRTFRYMTKINLFDGRREAEPMRYWYSRIDTRESIICSIYLDSGTYLKVTQSDTVLRRKMILTNATPRNPQGTGYRIDDWPMITQTGFRVARDMWALLDPRIENLETHGIHNERIQNLRKAGVASLAEAEQALAERRYDTFVESADRSWALASRVYSHVEEIQKDVLFGVLFYIALFVPFAFCMERLVYGTRNIHKRILAFLGILLLLIAVVYQVHPAFELAYSPMVVILAFFIMGLSLMVTLIIFFRFESEMVLLQRRVQERRAEEVSRWKAFVAAFFLGVSNLKRRRLRTVLTCTTLVILTFTIMSFTSVKSIRHHARVLFQNSAPYQGFLLKNVNWTDLPPEALGILINSFRGEGVVAPRAWLEDEDKTRTVPIPLKTDAGEFQARGLMGLSADEPYVTGLDEVLVGGRWFEKNERRVVLLSRRIAEALGIDPQKPAGAEVRLWGVPYRVVGVFAGDRLQERSDLDGEALTPVTFPDEVSVEMTEVELEAVESGEEVQAFQSRYQHVDGDLTVMVPYRDILSRPGGSLKGMAVRPDDPSTIPEKARHLVDRFGLTLFSGESDGTFMYNASDTLNYSGVPNILIPLVISIFIVLNTMIGSVYERKQEIGIYTSVGLAPSHVSFLFIAEALAFAVLSVVLGYLLAQVSAKFFAGTALWSGITVNYSSLAGVASMILVILVVLISVIYPSRVAADIAIPDVNRAWTFPDVRENSLELTLPFLVKFHEHDSIGGFLLSYFRGHQDVSHGLFSAGDIETAFLCPVVPGMKSVQENCNEETGDPPACIQLQARVWLAPFDFGIMQQVVIYFCASDENECFLEVNVRLVRETGEANAWKRINKAFLNDLRKQLLIWRSLDRVAHQEYAALLTAERSSRLAA
ncbi:MAG: FtsX-like permease family protein [Desulfococcaceae bacterium]